MSSFPLEPRWPPRSPHEALLSSPGGRDRLRQIHDRTSPSPSPLKRSAALPNLNSIRRRARPHKPAQDTEEEEEDEETLQLQLQALEAKLKLKKLQQKRKAAVGSSSDVEKDGRSDGRSATKENRPPSVETQAQTSRSVGYKGQATRDVQIAASPQKRMRAPEDVPSPKKVLLGIDKGLKGRNVSLKRAPSDLTQDDDPFRITAPSSRSSAFVGSSQKTSAPRADDPERPNISFSERIAQSRQEDARRCEHANRVRKQQSTGFGMAQEDVARAKRKFGEADEVKAKVLNRPLDFSREEVLKAASKSNSGVTKRSNTTSSIGRSQRTRSPSKSTDVWMNPNAEVELPRQSGAVSSPSYRRTRSQSPPAPTAESGRPPPASPGSTSGPLFESFSSFHLSNRLLPHDLLTKTFSSKSILRLPDLLASVKSPHYTLPDDLEADYVVLAIIASKSTPLTHKDKSTNPKPTSNNKDSTSLSEATTSEQNTTTNGKFMILTLSDLKWSLDLYLFNTGYTRFWKLTPGTVVALLNPSIMPPPPGKSDTGRFSLTLNSSDDTVLEIGRSRDLGWCSSLRKDGKPCGSWVDKRHTSVCEFHIDRVVERTRSARMEVAGMSAPFAPGGRRGGRTGHFGARKTSTDSSDAMKKGDGFAREGPQYDRSSRSTYFMAAPAMPGARNSAAQLLDAEGFQLDRAGGSKEERTRKRLAERERENEIARKLGEGGNGAGSEYLRLGRRAEAGAGGAGARVGNEGLEVGNVASLGLKRRAGEAHLSPLKKRRVELQGLKEVGDGRASARKKTRFVTERGIKVAGRDSLGFGGDGGKVEEEDDDELEVV